MKVYFASPLFSEAERTFNLALTQKLETLGLTVFLPQRDGVEAGKPPYDVMSKEERRKAMFELDRGMIRSSDIFLIVLDGRVPDEGACVELGIAYACKQEGHGKPHLIGLHTDMRAAFLDAHLNPMVKVPLDHLARTVDNLLAYVADLSKIDKDSARDVAKLVRQKLG